jgi:hypothetical protein
LIAGVVGLFIAVAGLAIALAPRHPAPSPEFHHGGQLKPPSQISLKMRRVSSGRDVDVVTDTRPGDKITTDMRDVTAERSIRYRIRAAPRARKPKADGDRDEMVQ